MKFVVRNKTKKLFLLLLFITSVPAVESEEEYSVELREKAAAPVEEGHRMRLRKRKGSIVYNEEEAAKKRFRPSSEVQASSSEEKWEPIYERLERELSEKRDPNKHYHLGLVYGTMGKFDKALQNYVAAFYDQHPAATYMLGHYYKTSKRRVPVKSLFAAYFFYKQAALLGFKTAEKEVASILEVKKDYKKYDVVIKKSLDGDHESSVFLAELFGKGLHINRGPDHPIDRYLGYVLYGRSVFLHKERSDIKIDFITYCFSSGIPEITEKGAKVLEILLESKSPIALYKMSQLLKEGTYYKQDLPLSERYLEQAIEGSCVRVSFMENPLKGIKSLDFLCSLSGEGNMKASYGLYEVYQNPSSKVYDITIAQHYLHVAAEQGDERAVDILAQQKKEQEEYEQRLKYHQQAQAEYYQSPYSVIPAHYPVDPYSRVALGYFGPPPPQVPPSTLPASYAPWPVYFNPGCEAAPVERVSVEQMSLRQQDEAIVPEAEENLPQDPYEYAFPTEAPGSAGGATSGNGV